MSREHIKSLRELVDLVAAETLGPSVENDPDEDSVGWKDDGPLPMTFGHVRRAQAAIAALSAAMPDNLSVDQPAQLPAVIDQPAEIELGFNATTLKMLLLQRAQVDREQTVQAMVQALAELDVIRPVRAGAVYNHMLIGAHESNRQEIADQIGRFLFSAGVIEFAQRPDVAGGRGMTALQGEVWVMIPKRMQGVDPAEGTEVVN